METKILGNKISWTGFNTTRIRLVGNNDRKIFLEIPKCNSYIYDVFCKLENRIEILKAGDLRIKIKKDLLEDMKIEISIDIMDPLFGSIFSSNYVYSDEDMKKIEDHYNKDSQ